MEELYNSVSKTNEICEYLINSDLPNLLSLKYSLDSASEIEGLASAAIMVRLCNRLLSAAVEETQLSNVLMTVEYSHWYEEFYVRCYDNQILADDGGCMEYDITDDMEIKISFVRDLYNNNKDIMSRLYSPIISDSDATIVCSTINSKYTTDKTNVYPECKLDDGMGDSEVYTLLILDDSPPSIMLFEMTNLLNSEIEKKLISDGIVLVDKKKPGFKV